MDDREPCGVYGAFAFHPLRSACHVNEWRDA
jgi:hypothetical protein